MSQSVRLRFHRPDFVPPGHSSVGPAFRRRSAGLDLNRSIRRYFCPSGNWNFGFPQHSRGAREFGALTGRLGSREGTKRVGAIDCEHDTPSGGCVMRCKRRCGCVKMD